MSVWRRYPDHGYPSLLTTNVEGRRGIFQNTEAIKQLLEVVEEVEREENFELHAYVVMPDHLHLVVSLRFGKSLGRMVQLIKGRFAWRYNRSRSRTGKVWQDRYHERALRDERELYSAIAYVHNNPVVAGLVDEDVLYPWSSAMKQRLQVRLRA